MMYREIPDRMAMDMYLAEVGLALSSLWTQSARADESTVVRGRHLAYGSPRRWPGRRALAHIS